jgi:hypothetical protein
VEGSNVRREYQIHKLEERRKMFVDGQTKEVVSRGAAEIASLSYGWQQTIENLNLQERVDKLYREDKHGRN